MLCLQHNIHTSYVIYRQQTQGKHVNFDKKTQGKMDGNHQKLRENDAENSVRTLSINEFQRLSVFKSSPSSIQNFIPYTAKVDIFIYS